MEKPSFQPLSDTDAKMVELVAQDKNDQEIALSLQLSKNAIEKRWAKLRKRFGVHSRAAVLSTVCRGNEARLKDEVGKLLAVFNILDQAVVIFDDKRLVTYANRAACKYLGLTQSQLLGNEKIWSQLTPEAASRQRIRQEFLGRVDICKFSNFAVQVTTRSGEEITSYWSSPEGASDIFPYIRIGLPNPIKYK